MVGFESPDIELPWQRSALSECCCLYNVFSGILYPLHMMGKHGNIYLINLIWPTGVWSADIATGGPTLAHWWFLVV